MSTLVTNQYEESLVPTSPRTSATPRSEELLEQIALRLERIEARMTRLEPVIEQIERLPALFAMGVDTFDDLAVLSAERGYDIDRMLKAAFELVPRIHNLLTSPEFSSLMNSGMLSPSTLNILSLVAEALNYAKSSPVGEAGVIRVMRSTRDKGVRRALHFAMQVLCEFGVQLDASSDVEDPEPTLSSASAVGAEQ